MNVSHARAAVAGAIAAVAVWGCVAMTSAPTVEPVEPVEVVTSAPVAVETISPVAPVEVAPEPSAPVQLEPVDDVLPISPAPTVEVDAPAACEEGFAMAEDGSCVPSDFWDATDVVLPACATEDDTDCYWDARTRSNGQGRSFVNLYGTTYYLGN